MLRNAIVVGGGIGGVAAAACLAQRGVEVTLFERAAQLREIGAGIFLKRNSLNVFEQLGCLDAVARHGSWLSFGELWDSTGRALSQRAIPANEVIVVPRADLHGALLERAGELGVIFKTSAEVVAADAEGCVTLADGSLHRASLVIGADGVGSKVRDHVGLTGYVRPTGNGSWRALVPRGTERADGVVEFWRGQRRLLVTPAGEDLLYFCASCRDDDAAASDAPFDTALWAREFERYAPWVLQADTASMVRRQHIEVKVKGWSRGNVAILGDAVHGQPPNLGQGAGCAIANAAALADCVTREGDVSTALAVWEGEERGLTEAIQQWSVQYDRVVHGWPTSLERARNVFVSFIANFQPTGRRWRRLSAGAKPA